MHLSTSSACVYKFNVDFLAYLAIELVKYVHRPVQESLPSGSKVDWFGVLIFR